MQDTVLIMGWNLFAAAALMIIGWLISIVYRNVTIVDSLWGLGFVVIAWVTFFGSDGYLSHKLLLAILVTIWGLRLSVYLSWRNWNNGEDPRYGRWREQCGEQFWLVSLYKVFILQALFLWVISLVIQIGQLAPGPLKLTWFDVLGYIVWAAGFTFESIADWQLARFKSDPASRGRVMDRGLWAYSRHPNYFGEFLIWWGFFLITLSTPGNWWTVISPLIMTAVLLKMTGIPLTESTILKTRPAYRDYIERTSAFVPWFPRKENT